MSMIQHQSSLIWWLPSHVERYYLYPLSPMDSVTSYQYRTQSETTEQNIHWAYLSNSVVNYDPSKSRSPTACSCSRWLVSSQSNPLQLTHLHCCIHSRIRALCLLVDFMPTSHPAQPHQSPNAVFTLAIASPSIKSHPPALLSSLACVLLLLDAWKIVLISFNKRYLWRSSFQQLVSGTVIDSLSWRWVSVSIFENWPSQNSAFDLDLDFQFRSENFYFSLFDSLYLFY